MAETKFDNTWLANGDTMAELLAKFVEFIGNILGFVWETYFIQSGELLSRAIEAPTSSPFEILFVLFFAAVVVKFDPEDPEDVNRLGAFKAQDGAGDEGRSGDDADNVDIVIIPARRSMLAWRVFCCLSGGPAADP